MSDVKLITKDLPYWLGGVVLCGLFNHSFAASEWEQVTGTQEYAIYMSAQRMKPVKTNAYNNNKPTQIEGWSKWIIVYDSKKDGRTVGDYDLRLSEYNCIDETIKLITATEYKSNGEIQGSPYTPSYSPANRVAPESIGEMQLKIACQVLDKMNNGEVVNRLIKGSIVAKEDADTQTFQEAIQKMRKAVRQLNSYHETGGMSLVKQQTEDCYNKQRDIEFCFYLDVTAKFQDDVFRRWMDSQEKAANMQEIEDKFSSITEYYNNDNFNSRAKSIVVPRYATNEEFKGLLDTVYATVSTIWLAEKGDKDAQKKVNTLLALKENNSLESKLKPNYRLKTAKPVVPTPKPLVKTKKLVRPNQKL